MTFPPPKNLKTVITPNRQPCFWHVQITRPNNTGWPVTSPVLFDQAKNSRDKAMMAKSGQKHGHYLALRHSCGVGNCLKIFFWPLDVMHSWAKKSSRVVPRGRGRDRRTGSSGMRRDPRLSAGRPSEVTGEKPGSRLEDRSADAPLRQQTSGSGPLRFAKFTQDKVQRVTFTDPFGGFVAKHSANKRFIVTTGTRMSRSSSRLWTLSDDTVFSDCICHNYKWRPKKEFWDVKQGFYPPNKGLIL